MATSKERIAALLRGEDPEGEGMPAAVAELPGPAELLEAVGTLAVALRENRYLAHDLMLWARKIQRGRYGALTDFIEVLTGKRDNE